ncbi:hypothetical protein STTU_3915 [Streptomyces sp. Tu6071]|nr:hypothetical protein STTU_3915 [Streptomyces sp. Tu6071]
MRVPALARDELLRWCSLFDRDVLLAMVGPCMAQVASLVA